MTQSSFLYSEKLWNKIGSQPTNEAYFVTRSTYGSKLYFVMKDAHVSELLLFKYTVISKLRVFPFTDLLQEKRKKMVGVGGGHQV